MKEDVTCSGNGVFVQFEVVDEGTQQGTGNIPDKGTYHLRFSGIRPLRGGGVPPFSAKEKNLLFFTLIFR